MTVPPLSIVGRARHRRLAMGVAAVLTVALAACSSSAKTASPAKKATSPKTTAPKTTATGTPVSSAGALTGNTPCEKSGPPASEGQVLDGDGHFHRGPLPQLAIDEKTRMALEAEQTLARAVVNKYPTVADATKAGYSQSTVYVPCIGAHYTNTSLAISFNVSAPSELLYDGTNPASRIVGLSYLVYHPGGAPDGFAGPNDRWHQHTFNGGLCAGRGGLIIGAESESEADCEKAGGHKIALTDIWMLHDWVVPGWECSWGVFASECPELGGKAGLDAWHA